MVSYSKSRPKIVQMLGLEGKFPIEFSRVVHDAQYYLVPYEMVLPFIHIMQWEATYGITKQYKDEFGLAFTVEPEIEVELGVKDTKSHKWDWELPNLIKIIEGTVDEGIETKIFTDTKEEILTKVLAPWKNPKVRAWLNKNYPLLNVDLDKEIANVVN